jgi:hypothetical protein
MRRDDHALLDAPVRSFKLLSFSFNRSPDAFSRYPPYTDKALNMMKSLMTLPELPAILPSTLRKIAIATTLGVIGIVAARYLG